MESADVVNEISHDAFVGVVRNGAPELGVCEPYVEGGFDDRKPPGSSRTSTGSFECAFNAVCGTAGTLDVEERRKLDVEISRIPDSEKNAYNDALRCASSFVLEKEANPAMFVLIENHQYDKAALRLIDYWKYRRDLFGDRAYRSIFDLSGNGALATEELEPFCRSLEHAVLPRDSLGRAVLYFDDEFLASSYYRDAYEDTRQCILFILLNFIAFSNMPFSQKEGFVTIRVIRRENYDLTKAVKHGSMLNFMPLVADSIHFCGIPPKGARRHFKEHLVPLLVGSSDNESDRQSGKEKVKNALSPFPLTSKFHMSSKRQSLATQLEESGLRRVGLPVSLGGEWVSTSSLFNATVSDPSQNTTQAKMMKLWSLVIQNASIVTLKNVTGVDHQELNATDQIAQEEVKSLKGEERHYETTEISFNEVNGTVFKEDRTFGDFPSCEMAIVQDSKPSRAAISGFRLLSKEANEAILEQRKSRKRQMDVIYARHRRSRDRCEVMILQERVAFMSETNRDLSKENGVLTKMLVDARSIVARFELKSSIVSNPMLLLNSNVPDVAPLFATCSDVLANYQVGPSARNIAANVCNLSRTTFPASVFQGSLPSLAPAQCLLHDSHGPLLSGQSLDAPLLQCLLEQARGQNELMQLLRQRLLLTPSSNTWAGNVANVDRLCDSGALLSPLLQYQTQALLPQVSRRQPLLPEVNFRHPSLILDDPNIVRVQADLLEQLLAFESQRRI